MAAGSSDEVEDTASPGKADVIPSIKRPFRVLSLDGGGMRGIYTAAFLARLIDQFARIRGTTALDLGAGFDLITGTSTGAIVGCALAVGRPMQEVVNLYRDHGPKIFPHRITGKRSALFRAARGSTYVRQGDQALREALTSVLGTRTMLDIFQVRNISLSIPAVLMSTHRAWVFKKTPRSGVRDDLYPLVDVCMATSAAPIYRSLAAIDDPNCAGGPKQVFADGGLWANNPIMVGLVDALTIAGPDQPIEIYSLGTCPRPEGDHLDEESAHRSMLDWSLGADVAPLSISAQEFAFDNMARLLANAMSDCGRSIRRVRFPNKAVPASMMPYLALDDTRPEAMDRLVHQAHTDADLTKSACDDRNNPEGAMISHLMNDLPAMPVSGVVWPTDDGRKG
ncbi:MULTISPECIES: patatin-like phospholipase family protein [Agrobacterium]|uniref:patatin-like phospholipase family protein n=1 Tax=Agrobacterium TaxID=357 RepID=UPI0012E8C8BD|nr:patatin-like phospholipase family protein [Agrobacterium vitis]MVA52608.1 patatin [Agrobacterium vitis]MVA63968.1 patatin [Agrobacterium vitis]NSZ77469.1 patatin-like phospholipase family protein [Agrobacterium tumefaciens]